ncbi:MAG: hypothetical protein LBO74_01505 [Candidatus Symbiothrix sp.]|jgi:hypothetical protein|nr:hypothetical protein [Candidatus Symbiothrix sp.]
MENKFKAAYNQIWKHLADKYDSEGNSVEDIVNEKSLHIILTRYFSHLSETEKQNLINELRAAEEKQGIPGNERI